MRHILWVCAVAIVVAGVAQMPVYAADQTTLSVTVAGVVTPPSATIVRVENVTAHTADIVADTNSTYANTALDVLLTFTDHNGQVTTQTVRRVTADATGRVTVPATQLLPGTPYGVTVQYSLANAQTYSAPSASVAFTTLIDAPHSLAAVVNPADPSTAVNLTVGVDGALTGTTTVFTIEVTNRRTGVTYTIQRTQNVDGSTMTLPVTALDPATTYDFRVRYARAGTTVTSAYSAVASATTIPLTPTITTIVPDPANADTGATVTIAVDAGVVGTTIDLTLFVRDTHTGQVTTIRTTVPVTGTTITVPLAGLTPGTTYDMQVQYAPTGTTAYSAVSAVASHTTAVPTAPVIVSVDADTAAPDHAATLTVTVDPDLVGQTMDFAVAVTDTRTGQTTIAHVTAVVTGATMTLPLSGLTPSTTYHINVRYAPAGTTAYSPSSNTVNHTTSAPSAPTIVSVTPVATAPATTATVTVAVSPQVIGTTVQMVVSVTDTQTGVVSTFPVTVAVTSSQIPVTITGLTPGGTYQITAQYGVDGAGSMSPLSPPVTYKAPTANNDDDDDDDDNDGNTNNNGAGNTPPVVVTPNTPSIPSDVLPTTPEDAGVTPPTPHIPGRTSDDGAEKEHTDDDTASSRRRGAGTMAFLGTTWTAAQERIVDFAQRAGVALTSATAETGYQAVAVAGAVAGALSAGAAGAVPLFSSALPGAFNGGIFLRFLELFGVLGRRKEERDWGTVFEKNTHLPIPAVKVVLADMKGEELATTYSDREGRFGFLVEPGTYYFQVHKKDFTVVTDLEHDGLYGNVYRGAPVTVTQDKVIVTNIAMESPTNDWAVYGQRAAARHRTSFAILKKYFFVVLYYAGFIATGIITVLFPSLFNITMLTLYVVIFIYQTFFKKKNYGEVVTATGAPIPFAVVSLHDMATGTKEKFAVTDGAGRYYMLANDGTYTIRAKGQPVSGVAFDKEATVTVREGIVKEDVVV